MCVLQLCTGVLAKFRGKKIVQASLEYLFGRPREGKVKHMQYFKQLLQREWQCPITHVIPVVYVACGTYNGQRSRIEIWQGRIGPTHREPNYTPDSTS